MVTQKQLDKDKEYLANKNSALDLDVKRMDMRWKNTHELYLKNQHDVDIVTTKWREEQIRHIGFQIVTEKIKIVLHTFAVVAGSLIGLLTYLNEIAVHIPIAP